MAEVILVVDDSRVNRRLLSVILQKAGYEVVEAANGTSAVQTAMEMRPDLILLDVIMPGLDGYKVCERIKNDPQTSDIPIIFLTAMANAKDKIRGLDTGAADYVTKPFDKGEVVARVRSQLRISSLTKKLTEANRELIEKQRRIDLDLEAAAGIQRSLLPQGPPRTAVLESAWRFKPCESIGGDIFNIARLDEHSFSVYMLDVSGHGVPSALVTVSVSQMLQPHTGTLVKKGKSEHPFYEISSPSEVLASLDQIMAPGEVLARLDQEYPIERFDKFFTITYVLINTYTGRLNYSNGGHPPPLLIHEDGSIDKLTTGGPLIGLGGLLPFEDEERTLQAGDCLILYTDGVLEQSDASDELFGEERLLEALGSVEGASLEALLDRIMDGVTKFSGGTPPGDDISLLGVRYNGPPSG